ncbi:DNA polymerase zeta catalytic subunit-like protein [Tanacetum coccineum]|uniref:DNA polymerase zeta catalytic subunit-like protein n=1 Tax=Tanacetum coccineum TaxID=301880 RepID=A0ABQ5CBY2_9ASTR
MSHPVFPLLAGCDKNQLGKNIKVVRSGRGVEYVSSFADLCAKHRIRYEFTAPYSPQQNGIVERKNCTLKELRGGKEKEETPYELWMGRKPSYQYLQVWGCLAKESGSSSRIDDEVVQDNRQRDDNDLQDERQDQPKEEKVEPRRSKKERTKKSFGPDFVSFMVENDPSSYREAITSSEGPRWKEAIKSEMDSILQNHTWELLDLPSGCKPLGYKWIFEKKMKADGTIDNHNYGLHYDRYLAIIEGYNDANWISDIKDSRSTGGYMFTLGWATISWKSSKKTVIAKSMMESEFITLDKCREEAEWLRQFVEDIPRWPKPVTAISIHCDSQSAIGRDHSIMYNRKYRHIRRRHNLIRQLLSTGVVSIDYVKSRDNIADPVIIRIFTLFYDSILSIINF